MWNATTNTNTRLLGPMKRIKTKKKRNKIVDDATVCFVRTAEKKKCSMHSSQKQHGNWKDMHRAPISNAHTTEKQRSKIKDCWVDISESNIYMHGITWTNTTKTQNQHCTKTAERSRRVKSAAAASVEPDRLNQSVYLPAVSRCRRINLIWVCVCAKGAVAVATTILLLCALLEPLSLSRDFFSVYHSDAIVHRTAQSFLGRQTVRTRFSFSSLAYDDDVRVSIFRWWTQFRVFCVFFVQDFVFDCS